MGTSSQVVCRLGRIRNKRIFRSILVVYLPDEVDAESIYLRALAERPDEVMVIANRGDERAAKVLDAAMRGACDAFYSHRKHQWEVVLALAVLFLLGVMVGVNV